MMTTRFATAANLDSVDAAVSLLQSLGAEICHPTDDSLFDLCQNGSFRSRRRLEAFATREQQEVFFIANLLGCTACVLFIGIVAGLFLGYLTLDSLDLRITQRASMDEDVRMYATRILPIVDERHRILVTLLVLNALAYETLPIFLDSLVPSWVAIILSTSLILIFGEIIPSGIFTGPRQLYLAYRMAPLMEFFLFLMYPIATPLAALLDSMVGDTTEDEGYHRGELAALVQIQHEQESTNFQKQPRLPHNKKKDPKTASAAKVTLGRSAFYGNHQNPNFSTISNPNWLDIKAELMERIRERAEEKDIDGESDITVAAAAIETLLPPLHPLEVDVIEGALQMKTRVTMDVYTPLSEVYSLSETLEMDKETMCIVYSKGFSRVPVYAPHPGDPNDFSRIRGFLITRQLMLVDWDHCREVSTLPLQRPVCVSPRMNLVDLLRLLQKGGYPMTFVCARPDLANKALKSGGYIPAEAGFMGLVTLSDIMESILQDRIYDEMDIRYRDWAVTKLTRWAATVLQEFYRKKKKTRDRSLERTQRRFSPAPSNGANERTWLLSNGNNNNNHNNNELNRSSNHSC